MMVKKNVFFSSLHLVEDQPGPTLLELITKRAMSFAKLIESIESLLIESKAFLKFTAGKFLALIASIILLSDRICAVVDLPGLNPFLFVRSDGSRMG